jgi:hypothetical protein
MKLSRAGNEEDRMELAIRPAGREQNPLWNEIR